ncbi:hypothetical protein C8Q69DRAFT_316398 [Paecilomyces variotii]|uniref:Uncharacterized protein n=1 Tax=Byssochlamys spectabilis TaxID=264951 RepID=A0A443HQK9_BYSSP|nr:hypothetical protein C8Q69DRAFT_316398 [Paecilomyces variotii]RWQ94105.1 hypothetical protein C8Q69DRAFT_316398 [Paecilomyces variotii]
MWSPGRIVGNRKSSRRRHCMQLRIGWPLLGEIIGERVWAGSACCCNGVPGVTSKLSLDGNGGGIDGSGRLVVNGGGRIKSSSPCFGGFCSRSEYPRFTLLVKASNPLWSINRSIDRSATSRVLASWGGGWSSVTSPIPAFSPTSPHLIPSLDLLFPRDLPPSPVASSSRNPSSFFPHLSACIPVTYSSSRDDIFRSVIPYTPLDFLLIASRAKKKDHWNLIEDHSLTAFIGVFRKSNTHSCPFRHLTKCSLRPSFLNDSYEVKSRYGRSSGIQKFRLIFWSYFQRSDASIE